MGKNSSRPGAALLITVALALTGCAGAGAEAEEAPTPTPTEEASTFLDDMRATEAFFGFSDAQLEDIGESVCAALRDGSSFDRIVELLALNDIDADQASDVIFASAKEYCPEQER